MSNVSVLFAVEAEQMLLAGLTKDAIDLCLEGLNAYPDYPAAFSILAKAYKEIGEKDRAQEVMGKALDKFPTNRLISFVSKIITEESKSFNETKNGGSSLNEFKEEKVNTVGGFNTSGKGELAETDIAGSEGYAQNENIAVNYQDVVNTGIENNSNNALSDIDPNSPDFDINSLISDDVLKEALPEESVHTSADLADSLQLVKPEVSDIDPNSPDFDINSLIGDDMLSEALSEESKQAGDNTSDGVINAEAENNLETGNFLDDIKNNPIEFDFAGFSGQESEEIEESDSIGENINEADSDTGVIAASSLSQIGQDIDSIMNETPVEYSDNEMLPDDDEECSAALIPGFLLKLEQNAFNDNIAVENLAKNDFTAKNLDVIPGLDFSPFDSNYNFRNRISALTALPDIPFTNLTPITGLGKDNEEFSIEDLALKLQNAHIPKLDMNAIDEEVEDLSEQNESADIITETIANIYVMQGAIEEAKVAYKQLASQFPDRADYFLSKADSL